MSLRVVLVVSNLDYGGAQRQVVELANHADPRRLELHLCSLSDHMPLAPTLCLEPARVHVLRRRFAFDVGVVLRLARLLSAVRAEVVHGYLFDAEIAARLAGRLARTPVVAASSRNAEYRLRGHHMVLQKLTRGLVDLVVANSHAGAAFHRRLLRFPRRAYRVVPNGVDTRRFAPGDGAEVRRELGLEPDAPVVGMFASFKPQKNHALLLHAAVRLAAAVPRLRLLLVGDVLFGGLQGTTPYARRMQALLERLGLRPRCVFAGNRADVERLYRACDVTVLPSHHEGCPNVVLESLASGVPVVVTDVADNARLVPDGRVGCLVPPGAPGALAERLARLLLAHGLRARMAGEARAWAVQELSAGRLAERTEAVYRGALSARATRTSRSCSAGRA